MNFKQLKTELLKLELKNNIALNGCIVTDAKKFVDTHISFLENNSGKATFKAYFDRLIEYYNKIK